MKATGIVRRMDDLGRVVVPKELRRTMKISEGTPLEIFIDKDGSIIFRKYSPVGELNESAKNMAECISAASGIGTAVCDRDRIIATAGIPKKDLLSLEFAEGGCFACENSIKKDTRLLCFQHTLDFILVTFMNGQIVGVGKDQDRKTDV